MNAWLMEQFPAKHRLTSAALGYDLAHCAASAFSPLVATVLVKNYGNLAPAAMYPFFALLALLGMFLSRKTSGDSEDSPRESANNTETLSSLSDPLL